MPPKETILAYWESWQSHSDWEETRRYMKDDFKFDAGVFKTESADQLIASMKQGNPWKDIILLDVVMEGNKGSVLYEGVDSVTNKKFRIADFYTVEGEKVAGCVSVITELPKLK